MDDHAIAQVGALFRDMERCCSVPATRTQTAPRTSSRAGNNRPKRPLKMSHLRIDDSLATFTLRPLVRNCACNMMPSMPRCFLGACYHAQSHSSSVGLLEASVEVRSAGSSIAGAPSQSIKLLNTSSHPYKGTNAGFRTAAALLIVLCVLRTEALSTRCRCHAALS
eukprot:4724948-Amphidinium_carterae.1